MIKVSVYKRRSRSAKDANKYYLYLKFTPAILNPATMKTTRYESLDIYCYRVPETADQEAYNKEMMEKAEARRCQRQISIVNEDFGFIDKSVNMEDFLAYFESLVPSGNSKALSAFIHFYRFTNGRCLFGNLNVFLCEKFRAYLLNEAAGRRGRISSNSAAGYFSVFRGVLKEAYRTRKIKENLNDFLEKIPTKQPKRTYLTLKEVKQLNSTPCRFPILKRAAMFSVLTGLRISDIKTLEWKHITTAPDGEPCIIKKIVKSNRDEVIFISREALELCGKPSEGLIFEGITKDLAYRELGEWVKEAGITKHVTFHVFRHTNATLLMASGNDIYTVSKMLTHRNVGTTQIYADVVDELKRNAANSLSLK